MKKNLLVAAIGATMGVATVAQGDALLFPFFESDVSSGVYSFLTLANVQGVGSPIAYTWGYQREGVGAGCDHEDADGALTEWDIIHHTVVAPSISGLDLPAHPAFLDSSVPAYSLVSDPIFGYVIADSAGGESTLAGQMITVDVPNNVIYAERGMNNPGSLIGGTWNSIFTSHPSYDLVWYPNNVVRTTWNVLVTGVGMDIPGYAGAGVLQSGFAFDEVFDQDEIPRSGDAFFNVTCLARVGRSDIMTNEQLVHTDQGGYTWLTFAPTPGTGSTGVLMHKIQTTAELGGKTVISLDTPWPNLPF